MCASKHTLTGHRASKHAHRTRLFTKRAQLPQDLCAVHSVTSRATFAAFGDFFCDIIGSFEEVKLWFLRNRVISEHAKGIYGDDDGAV